MSENEMLEEIKSLSPSEEAILTMLIRYQNLKAEIEKEKEKNKDLKEGYKIQEHNYQVAMEEIEQRWKDIIIAKVIEIKDRPVKDEFITATQGKLNTIIDIENLLDEEETDKNKKLKDKAKELIFEKQELTSALLDSTPDDKIKSKIEEIEQWELYNMKIPKLNTLDERLGAKIGIKYILQSLLEKE